jgi:4-amino-4-deoxy-L-arabinose transferase-like glycosyltransferase
MHTLENTSYSKNSPCYRSGALNNTCLLSGKWWSIALVVIFMIGISLYSSFFVKYSLFDPDEGRYAEIAREMLETGDFITPHLNYVKYLEKPPLFYWLTAGSMALFGQNEGAARFVPEMSGFLTLLIVIFMGRAMFGARTGLAAGWIYITSIEPFIMSQFTVIDMLFSMLLTASWSALWFAYNAPSIPRKRGWITLAWVCLGLATMAKGPVAIFLTGLIILLFEASVRDREILHTIFWWPGPLLFGIIVIPWHVAVGYLNPEFWHFYIVVQHFDRAMGNEHVRPFWFFLATLPFGILFWSAFLFPAIFDAVKSGVLFLKSGLKPSSDTTDKKHLSFYSPALQESFSVFFLGIWIFAVVGLFSLSKCKLIPYVLPAYPAIALLTAWHLNRALYRRSTFWCLIITIIFLAGIFLAIPYAARHQDTIPYNEISGLAHFTQVITVVSIGLVFLALFNRKFVLPVMGLILILMVPTLGKTVQVSNRYRKIGDMVKSMPNPLPAEIRIAEWSNFDRSLAFYTQRRIILIDEDNEMVFRAKSRDFKQFFLKGKESLRKIADQGPLLVNMRPESWKEVRQWGVLYPVAANSTNLMVANEEFFRLTKLIPWPETAIKPRPLLLMPRYADTKEGCP